MTRPGKQNCGGVRRLSGCIPLPDPFTGLPRRQARVVLADPPWHFATYSPKGWRKSAHAKYPCMTVDVIAGLPVRELCADDCLLALWSTQTHVPMALQVMAAWGFVFKTAGAWAKQSRTGAHWHFGTGYLLRSATEFFLIGTRGRIEQLTHDNRNLIVAPTREHSRKPEAMYALIERAWPGPYVELFATPKAGRHGAIRFACRPIGRRPAQRSCATLYCRHDPHRPR
jgi:N6-adenosine-specific RNA methylase IME4